MIIKKWEKISRYPFGKQFFNFLIRVFIPYTGTIRPEVLELKNGKSRIQMRDRRRVRNHLNSIHAIALMNLGEAATGLAVTSRLPDTARAIITHLEIDFIKKARGTLICQCVFNENLDSLTERRTLIVESEIKNAAEEIVAKVKAHWLVGPNNR